MNQMGCPEVYSNRRCSSISLMPVLRDPVCDARDAVFAETFDRKMVRMGHHKLIVEDESQQMELYDLAADPGETVNLTREASDSDRPTSDPAHLDVIRRLRERMVTWEHACDAEK